MTRMALASAILTATCLPTAYALDCSDLKPTPTQNTETTYSGKIDGAIDGLFAKVAGVQTSADGTYRKVATSVLQQFPNGDTTYMWERILYLQCQLLSESKGIPTREKMADLSDLYSKFTKPPPSLQPSAASNSLINTGNGMNSIQGSGNNMSVNGPRQP